LCCIYLFFLYVSEKLKMSAPDRKAELERKRAKLNAMRDERKRIADEKAKKAGGTVTETSSTSVTNADQILDEVGIKAPPPDESSPVRNPDVLDAPDSPKVLSPKVQRKKVQLEVSTMTQTNYPPKENVSYSKETQTILEMADKDVRPWDYYDDDADSLDANGDSSRHQSLSMVGSVHKMPQVHSIAPAQTPDDAVITPREEESKNIVKELSEEEKRKIFNSEDYIKFCDRASRVMERAMAEHVDIFTDYGGIDGEDEDLGLTDGEKLKVNRQFFDERWSKHRTVTCFDWSLQHPELLVASYSQNDEAPNEPDGIALIWNTKYKKSTPEYIFHCQSPVMSACFAKFHPNFVVGGTYSGQIVLWDNRSNKKTPVQRTPLSATAHTHPVYCVSVVGTQNAHNLISVSTDGKMCSWSLDMLSQPQDSMELQHKQSKAVAVTSLSFMSADVNNFVVGSEEGMVYSACRHGSKAGVADMFEGHQGPVTGIDTHQVPGSIDFSPYFLTSSFDWTVKLWNIKESQPVHSFEDNSDYVYDVRWSPVHPALFASVDGNGRVDLWNLNNDTEVPTASITVDGNVALNRCRWHQSGHTLAVGDDMGKIHIYDVGENLAVPRSDEWSRFVHTLQELKNQQAEQEDDSNLLSASPLR